MKVLWATICTLCLMTSSWALEDLKELLKEDGKIFSTTAKDFMTPDKGEYFFWLNKGHTGGRYSDERATKKLTFFGMKVWEVVIRFTPTGTKEINISLYNRGDAGGLDEAGFTALFDELDQKLTDWAEGEGEDLKRVRLAKGKGYIRSRSWHKLPYLVVAEWTAGEQRVGGNSMKTYRADYLRLKIKEKTSTKTSRSSSSQSGLTTRATTSREKLTDNVVSADNGDVYVDKVPMVDQGLKGYCAVCVAARLLKYYGSDIGQDTIAQLADSKSEGGTNNDKMMEMIGNAGVKLGIKVKNYKMWNMKDFKKLLKDYNRLAKRAGKRELTVHSHVREFWDHVDGGILKETRCVKQKNDYSKFLTNIEKNVKLGIPVIWGVTVGVFPENKILPQESGGHLRLVIGYNKKEKKLLFSDTWGAGHERKYMDMDQAWAITNSYSTFTPRNR